MEFNDDGGTGTFSKIDRVCDVNELGPGSYYIKVDDYGNNSVIDSYDIELMAEIIPISISFKKIPPKPDVKILSPILF